jgi:hypothetical protein
MRVVDQSIQDRVGQRRMPSRQRRVPVLNWQLADHQRRTELGAIVDHLEQILGFDDIRRGQQKVVDDQQCDTRQLSETTYVATIAAADRQVGQQPRCADVQRRMPAPNGRVRQCGGYE